MRSFILVLLLIGLLPFCKRNEKFPAIGDKVVSPVDIEVSDNGEYFYVLNADFDRTYNKGSILVLDKDGNKVKAVETLRMGRSLTLAGNDLIATVDYQDKGAPPHAYLYDVSDPANPILKKDWELPCSPFNAVARKGYKYFALTCVEGGLMIGSLADDRTQSTLKLVRDYGIARRALYLDPARGLLLGFATVADTAKQSWVDGAFKDVATYDDMAREVKVENASVSNEVPDDFENTKRALSNRYGHQVYQFFVYNLDQEAAPTDCRVTDTENCIFPWRTLSDSVVKKELRWLYFKLFNFDGTPDPGSLQDDPSYKYYRTNFWSAEPDPSDPDVFYLSHRGIPSKGVAQGNQVVRVNIIGDLTVAEDGKVPSTESALSFERVFGFNGVEANKYYYPGDFVVQEVSGRRLLLINNFRDLVNWVRGDVYFSVAAKIVDDNSWFAETTVTTDPLTSWYQLAMNRQGRAVAGLFYGNAVMLLDVTPGVGIKELKRIQ